MWNVDLLSTLHIKVESSLTNLQTWHLVFPQQNIRLTVSVQLQFSGHQYVADQLVRTAGSPTENCGVKNMQTSSFQIKPPPPAVILTLTPMPAVTLTLILIQTLSLILTPNPNSNQDHQSHTAKTKKK